MKAPAFWYRRPGPLAAVLAPAAALYAALGGWRQSRITPQAVGIPVICIGNLVAGGQGKTPVALAVAAAVTARAPVAVQFLTRGYGGRLAGPVAVDLGRHDATAVGDEALLLARLAPTWLAHDRVAGAQSALAAGAELLIMDDGFQNPGLAKDLSLIVVDGATGFGNGRVIPAGPLREPIATGLKRATAVVVVGEDRAGVAAQIRGRLPKLTARLVAEPNHAAAIRGQRVLAFAGIGRPTKFFETCRAVGATVVAGVSFPDHHRYRPEQIMSLVERAAALGAVPVTTAKDAVRLPPEARAMVQVLAVALEWDDPGALDRLLDPYVSEPARRRDGSSQ